MAIDDELKAFMEEWQSPSPTIEVQTSGSTGKPKRIQVSKERMWNSARITCDYLGLKKGDSALLCMPLRYIAGKMMVIRSLYAGMELITREPSGHPFANWHGNAPKFTAMIPMQVYNTLQVPEERELLERTEILIIGGGAIDESLECEIKTLPNRIYSTYGMTETLSHIALRKLNGQDASASYMPFPSVKISLSKEETLVIDAPLVCEERLVTNDVASILPDGSFTIMGRRDNIINSGGIKIQIEDVERALKPHFGNIAFAISSIPDHKFGEVITLLIEPGITKEAMDSAIESLPKYWRPRVTINVDVIPMTGSGKIDRAGCRELACKLTINNKP